MTSTVVEVKQPTTLARPKMSLGIQGLEEEDTSILPIPFVRLVQGQSKKVKMKDGKEAPEGWFFWDDTKEAIPELHMAILKSKVVATVFEDPTTGKPKTVNQRKIVFVSLDSKKVGMLTISTMSFSRYGRLIAEMKQNNVTEVWSHIIRATSEKTENDKGKFQVVNFEFGEALTEEDKIEMGLVYEQFKHIFEKPQDADAVNESPYNEPEPEDEKF